MTDKRIRVLYIIDGLHGGGKERQLVEIIRSFVQNGSLSVGVITFNRNKHYSEIVKNLVPYFVELKKRPTRLEPLFSIWKHISEFKPNIIHTWDSLSSFYSWLPSRVLKINLIDGSIRDAGIEKGWQLVMKKFFLLRADKIIANSNAGLSAYNVKGEVLHNAINPARFTIKQIGDKFNIIMTANFTDYKDQKTFIDAAAKLKYDGIIDNVYLAGEGPHRLKYVQYINNSFPQIKDSFRFLGSVSNIEAILSECRVGVLCSTSKFGEGVSNSILEYMAAGLIAIGTDIGGTPEIIEDGINGFMVKEGDSDAIVRIVKKVRGDNDLANRIIRNAKVTIESKFSYEKNCEKLIEIYKGLCKEN